MCLHRTMFIVSSENLKTRGICFDSLTLFISTGMHHQGVFRVSGSQHEINDMKNSFEKGTCISFMWGPDRVHFASFR